MSIIQHYIKPWQIDSLKLLLGDLEKQLNSLKAASQPPKAELDRLKELENIISAEEKEIDKLTQGSKQLKEKVSLFSSLYPLLVILLYILIVVIPLS